jgi:hypothetical protein
MLDKTRTNSDWVKGLRASHRGDVKVMVLVGECQKAIGGETSVAESQ